MLLGQLRPELKVHRIVEVSVDLERGVVALKSLCGRRSEPGWQTVMPVIDRYCKTCEKIVSARKAAGRQE